MSIQIEIKINNNNNNKNEFHIKSLKKINKYSKKLDKHHIKFLHGILKKKYNQSKNFKELPKKNKFRRIIEKLCLELQNWIRKLTVGASKILNS
jgi:Na+/phosphate symporter